VAFTENTSPAEPPVPSARAYPVRFDVDSLDGPRDRLTALFRLIMAIPVGLLAALLPGAAGISLGTSYRFPRSAAPLEPGAAGPFDAIVTGLRELESLGLLGPLTFVLVGVLLLAFILVSGAFAASDGAVLAIPVVLVLLIRGKYPGWWFEWNRAVARFTTRIGVYVWLLRDEYPAIEEEQAVHLEIDRPDATSLNRALPLLKWLLLFPHWFLLGLLFPTRALIGFLSWVVIVVSGRMPRSFFDFQVASMRWGKRVAGYAPLFVTDEYPPFGLGSTETTLTAVAIGALLWVASAAVSIALLDWLVGMLLRTGGQGLFF
jgi:hypothetical protein